MTACSRQHTASRQRLLNDCGHPAAALLECVSVASSLLCGA